MSAAQLATSLFKPQKSAVIFATKGVIAMAASLYIAMYFNLERPYWALISAVFLQIRPESGLVIEKGLCQIVGSLVGGLVGILILELFMPYPLLALGTLGLWLGTVAYWSAMVRRTNFIYLFAMAGITAILIVVLVMVTPQTANSFNIFDVAQSRVSELIVGSLCATIISQLFWPITVKDNLQMHARKVINECLDYFSLEISCEGNHEDRHARIDTIFDSLTILSDDSSAVRYEGPNGAGLSRAATLLCNKVMSLLAVVQIFGRLKRNHPELITPMLSQVIDEMQQAFLAMKQTTNYNECYQLAQNLRRTQLRLRNTYVASSAIEVRLVKIAMEMAAELTIVLKSFNALNENTDILLKAKNFKPYRNRMVGLSVLIRTTSIFFIGAGLWVGTGSTAVMMMMILPVVFSIMMARLPLGIVSIVLKRLVVGAVIACLVAVFFALNLLAKSPGDFPVLILILAGPYFLGLLALANRPTLPYGLGFCIPFTILVRPSMDMSYSFQIDSAISNAMSIVIGVTTLYWLFQLITAPSVKSIQKDLIAETIKDIKKISNQPNSIDWFNARMGDRVLRIVAFDKAKVSSKRIMTDLALTGLNLGHIVVRMSAFYTSLIPGKEAQKVWNEWVSELSNSFHNAAIGQYSCSFIEANDRLLTFMLRSHVSCQDVEMFEGMCERLSLTFERTSSIVSELKSNGKKQ